MIPKQLVRYDQVRRVRVLQRVYCTARNGYQRPGRGDDPTRPWASQRLTTASQGVPGRVIDPMTHEMSLWQGAFS